MKREKIIIYVLALSSIAVMIVLCISLKIFQHKNYSEFFCTISVEDAILKIEEKSDIILYCGQETCSACRAFAPELKQIADEENKEIFYLDVDLISSQKELQRYQIQETPTLITISNGDMAVYRGTMAREDIRQAITSMESEKVQLKGLEEISENELKEMEDEKTDFILYIGRDDCGDCQMFQPILEQYLSEDSNGVYYLNIKTIREKAKEENASERDIKIYDDLVEKYDINWVPLLIHIRNGLQVSRFEFLDDSYAALEESDKEEMKDDYVKKFYYWIEREAMTYGRE